MLRRPANGEVRNPNATFNIYLIWVLKRGNRFEIVTSFDMKMYPLGVVCGGILTYAYSSLLEVLTQADKYRGQDRSPKSSIIVDIIDGIDMGYSQFVEVVFHYGKGISSPPDVSKPFFEVPGIIANAFSRQSFSDLVSTGREGLDLPGVFSYT
ncbi:hypothetical protein AA313_de0204367 [Arthrobotrys entomopaga]|nr:hypothetical protein AA313_de0204367 [Arthrobotrys entomopaga]